MTTAAPAAPTAQLRDHVHALAETGTTLDQFVELTVLKRNLKKIERELNQLLADRDEAFREELVERGERSAGHAASGKTAYIVRKVWARVQRDGDQATQDEHTAASAALRAAGLSEFQGVKVNVQGLSAYFREQVERETEKRISAGDPRPVDLTELLPEELRGFIDLSEDAALGLR